MKALVIIFLPTREVHREKVQHARAIKALPMKTAPANKPNAPHPFWTWFIENPARVTSHELAA